jgi:hypothetical protein
LRGLRSPVAVDPDTEVHQDQCRSCYRRVRLPR